MNIRSVSWIQINEFDSNENKHKKKQNQKSPKLRHARTQIVQHQNKHTGTERKIAQDKQEQ